MKGLPLSPTKAKAGRYYQCAVNVDGKVFSFQVHRLQAFQKFGEKIFEKGIVVRHLNGNPLDNSWKNIEIGTQSENQLDRSLKCRTSGAIKAASHVRRFTDEEVEEIRAFHKESKSYKETMAKFGMKHKGTLYHVLTNKYVTKK